MAKKYKIQSPYKDVILQETEMTYLSSGLLTASYLFKSILDLVGFIQPSIPQVSHETDLIHIIRQGLNKRHLDHLLVTTGLALSDLAKLIHVSERTLHRYQTHTVLNPEISERLLEIARVYVKGTSVFGDLNRFKKWIECPSWSLGERTPLSYLDTSMGIKIIEDELGRIEHGIVS